MSFTELNTFSIYWIILALILTPIQLKIIVPYGRHVHNKWGLMIDNKLGWILMEIVSPLVLVFLLFRSQTPNFTTLFIAGLWLIHYFNRSIIFPFRIKTKGKKMPLTIALSAIFFNSINAGLNGYYLGKFGNNYTIEWLFDGRFIIGLCLFLTGAIINIQSDNILLNLRKSGEKGYKIPKGGLFKYISCPNHFGEIVEWLGFAILCWNLPALSFAIWTAANLIPRALAHHQWYQKNFATYPKERKALVSFAFLKK